MRLGPRVGDKARFSRIIALARPIENLQTDMAIDRNLDRGIGGAEASLTELPDDLIRTDRLSDQRVFRIVPRPIAAVFAGLIGRVALRQNRGTAWPRHVRGWLAVVRRGRFRDRIPPVHGIAIKCGVQRIDVDRLCHRLRAMGLRCVLG